MFLVPVRFFGLVALVSLLNDSPAFGLPTFSMRERLPCTSCHINGSAPQLTRYGFSYRRAGYRNPSNIGGSEKDLKAMTLTEHMAVGLNVDYGYATNLGRGAEKAKPIANQFFVRALEFWPLVGAFHGRVGVFSKVESTPATVSPGTDVAPSGGGTSLNRSELVYVLGDMDLFFNFRGGLIAGQGYGAADQWLDHGNLPFIDLLSARLNQDTLVTPLGANNVSQLGVEIGVAARSAAFITLGAYNGFDGTTGLTSSNQAARSPVLNNGYANGRKDLKCQFDYFMTDTTEITGIYYRGTVSLLDPTDMGIWQNHYSTWRLYLTQNIAEKFVLLAGAANGIYEFKDTENSKRPGNFLSPGGFAGISIVQAGPFTASARYDVFKYSVFQGASQQATGGALMVGIPMENTLLTFHYNTKRSDLDGLTKDLRAEWRLIF